MNTLLRAAMTMVSPAGQSGRLSIFIFHRVLNDPDPLFPDEPDRVRFDELMSWVCGAFNVLPLSDAIKRLEQGTLPARAASITFDDGYADNLTNAVPILKKHGLHATFFIATGFLDGGRMWNDTLIEAIRRTGLAKLDTGLEGLPVFNVETAEQKRTTLAQLIPALKHLEPTERSNSVAIVAARSKAFLPEDLMLTTKQLRTLRDSGMGIGAHTVNHPILASLDDDVAREEIAAGKAFLEATLDAPVTLFAYPNGKPGQDYLAKHARMVRDLGFDAAVSTQWGSNDRAADTYQLARFTPWDRGRLKFGLRMLHNMRIDGRDGVV